MSNNPEDTSINTTSTTTNPPAPKEVQTRTYLFRGVVFDDVEDNIPKYTEEPLESLLGEAPEVRLEKPGPCFSPALYMQGTTRGKKNVTALTMLVLDYDHITNAQRNQLFERLKGRAHVICTTFSDGIGGVDDRCFRVLLLLTRDLNVLELPIVRSVVVGEIGVPVDESAKDPSRIFYLPTTHPERAINGFVRFNDGVLLDPDAYIAMSPPLALTTATNPAGPVGPAGSAEADLDAPVTLQTLQTRLRGLKNPERRALMRRVLEGEPFAPKGSRDRTLWKVMSIAAFVAPEAYSELLVELVRPSLERMAQLEPDDHLTLEQALNKADLALKDAREKHAKALKRADHTELATVLLRPLQPNIVFDQGRFYSYGDKGFWQEVEEEELSRRVQEMAGALVVKDVRQSELRVDANTISGAIKCARAQVGRRGFFGDAPMGFAFQNAFVTVDREGISLNPLAPQNRARSLMPFDFSLDAMCPRFDAFLSEIFLNDPDVTQKIALIEEFVGACLVGDATRMAKALVLLGEGRNGKSTLIKILAALFPPEACSAIPPHEFEREYYRAQLAGKRFNHIAELPRVELLKGETFKALVAGDVITGRKTHHNPISFKPIAGHVMAANALPNVDDQSPALWARLVVVSFNRRFEESEQEKGLAEYIIENELPGVALRMFKGAARLAKMGAKAQYTIPDSHHALLDEWRRNSDQVRQFLEDRTTAPQAPEDRVEAHVLYLGYVDWAKEHGHRVLASNTFAMRVKALGVEHRKPGNRRFYLLRLNGASSFKPFTHSKFGDPPDPTIPPTTYFFKPKA